MDTKSNLLIYLKKKNLSKADFYKTTGLSNGFLDKGGSVTSANLETILKNYPDLSLDWLVTSHGPMLRNHGIINSGNGQQVVANHNNGTINADNRQYYSDSPDVLRAQIDTLNERIKEKDAQIKEKDAQIKEKDAQINKLIELLGKKYESGQ